MVDVKFEQCFVVTGVAPTPFILPHRKLEENGTAYVRLESNASIYSLLGFPGKYRACRPQDQRRTVAMSTSSTLKALKALRAKHGAASHSAPAVMVGVGFDDDDTPKKRYKKSNACEREIEVTCPPVGGLPARSMKMVSSRHTRYPLEIEASADVIFYIRARIKLDLAASTSDEQHPWPPVSSHVDAESDSEDVVEDDA